MLLLEMNLDPSVLFTSAGLISLITLSVLEIVLGIDNIIVISILSSELPHSQQARARRIGLAIAMITRLLLLFTISWMASMTTVLFSLFGMDFSGRDLVLLLGGLFLVYKAIKETYMKVEMIHEKAAGVRVSSSMAMVIAQIVVIDIVFSLDSVITAVGMSNQLIIMSLAVIFAVLVMLLASGPISAFVNRHATVKVLALAFLILIGVALILEGIHIHFDRSYLYAAMGFSVLVEALNLRMRRNAERMMVGGVGPDEKDLPKAE